MNEIPHKFDIGEVVLITNSLSKKRGTVILKDRSYGWPTYQVRLEDTTVMTLCESDLAKTK